MKFSTLLGVLFIFVTCVFVAPVENILLSIAWRVSGDMKTDMVSLSLITSVFY